MNITPENILNILIGMIAFIISGSVHEFSHAFAAYKLGDDTAKKAGRLTLNPIAHIDIFGSIFFPLISAITGFAIIGWMRPVPVNRNYLKNPSKDHALTAFAGPFSNFLQASLWLIVLKLLVDIGVQPRGIFEIVYKFIDLFFRINLYLMIFNLLPIPPLDGGWILRHFLPEQGKKLYDKYIRYGFIILYALLFIGGLKILFTPISVIISLIGKNMIIVHFLVFCIPAVIGISLLSLFLKNNFKKNNDSDINNWYN